MKIVNQKPLTIIAKSSIVDVRLGSKYASIIGSLPIGCRDVFRALPNIYDERLWEKISVEKAPSKMFGKILNSLLVQGVFVNVAR